jgi:putative CocE/NonD family hydrolase
MSRKSTTAAVLALLTLTGLAQGQAATPASIAPTSDFTDIPATFTPDTSSFDFIRREAMIPMRDGVKLHTVLMIPKGAVGAPMLLDRTPYNADRLTSRSDSSHGDAVLPLAYGELFDAGYIIVAQDVRGKDGSEGDYVSTRPLAGPLNPTRVDHSTDAYDTIAWLVKNTPESNGRVGTLGTSYDGFTTLMSLVNPHPALKAAVPMNPMVDAWRGDDDYHNGALRQIGLDYYYEQTSTRNSRESIWRSGYDDYTIMLRAGSAYDIGKLFGGQALPAWTHVLDHPAYDDYWRGQAMDKILGARPLTVPVLLVHSLWDQEDIYGALAVFAAIKPKDADNSKVFLAIGPWHHGQENHEAASLGAIRFDGDTGRQFRRNVLLPFLDAHLKTGGAAATLPVVTAYETGTNRWKGYERWPLSCATGCPSVSRPLYLQADSGLSFDRPKAGGADADAYVSDPRKPVPYRLRPIRPTYAKDSTWSRWLVDDQRPFSDRTDVLTYQTEPLRTPLKIAGAPIAHLFASTTADDADFVVKLIDVYPESDPEQPEMGGYQLAVSMDVLRGRYRDDPAHPKPFVRGATTAVDVPLPNANHVFLPGHRLMVQIQSSWFPLYDRNPQGWVPNIAYARPADYVAATIQVFHAPGAASFIELPVADR